MCDALACVSVLQLKVLAAEALANKAAGPTQQPGRQTQQPVDVSAAAAALLDARWQEETAEGSQGGWLTIGLGAWLSGTACTKPGGR